MLKICIFCYLSMQNINHRGTGKTSKFKTGVTTLILTLVIFRYNDLFEKSVHNINNLFFYGGIEVIPIYKQYNPRSVFYGVFGVVLRFVLQQTKLLDGV